MNPADREAEVRRRRRRIGAVVGVVGLLLLAAAISRSLGDLRKGRAHESELTTQIEASQARIEALERRAEALESDPAAIETLAREELLMARPDDFVILLPDESAAQAQASTDPQTGQETP